jgi:hypothetical protein
MSELESTPDDERRSDAPPAQHSSSAAAPPADAPAAESPVAAALAELDALPQLELADHPERYERVHRVLQDALRSVDDA